MKMLKMQEGSQEGDPVTCALESPLEAPGTTCGDAADTVSAVAARRSGATPVTAVESREHLVAAALVVAESFSSLGERQLLDRGREGLRDPLISYSRADDKLPAAMALALLRPLRLLSVAGHGPDCIGELAYMHVHEAARCCSTLRDSTGAHVALRDWLWDAGLRYWTVDERAWLGRRQRAQAERRHVTAHAAHAACGGSTVAVATATTLTSGPMDGARGVELIFDDGQAVVVPHGGSVPPLGQLLGATLGACSGHRAAPSWQFAARRSKVVALPLTAAAGVLLQPSPLTLAVT